MAEPTLGVMFHDDWELYGDGSGDPDRLMFDPGKRLMETCDAFGAKYTFFAEVGQQFAMLSSTHPTHQEIARRWEEFLRAAVGRGHDVQLHLHPQWLGARFDKGGWVLDYSRWSLASLPVPELEKVLRDGVDYLRHVLSPADVGYKVVAFRAGSWMAQPSGAILSAMCATGLIADVTVVKGLVLKNEELGSVDFSAAPSDFIPWFAHPLDVAKRSDVPGGIICIPTCGAIARMPVSLWEVLRNLSALPHVLGRRGHEASSSYRPVFVRQGIRPPTLFSRLGSIFRERVVVADFGRLHYSVLVGMLHDVLHRARRAGIAGELPVIMMTHSKSFYSIENFRRLLEKLSSMHEIRFVTTRDAVRTLKARMLELHPHTSAVTPRELR